VCLVTELSAVVLQSFINRLTEGTHDYLNLHDGFYGIVSQYHKPCTSVSAFYLPMSGVRLSWGEGAVWRYIPSLLLYAVYCMDHAETFTQIPWSINDMPYLNFPVNDVLELKEVENS
jgi:hypothetical protein